MLSDEEKKTIEILGEFKKNGFHLLNLKYESRVSTTKHIENSIETILNLIEKQSKEIEELKNADLTTVYLNGFYDGEKKVKDKIKAKIEEVSNGTYDAKIVLESLLEKKLPTTITKEELEKRWKGVDNGRIYNKI